MNALQSPLTSRDSSNPSSPASSNPGFLLPPATIMIEDSKTRQVLNKHRELLEKVGSPKNPESPNRTDLDSIIRTVMRHPDPEAIKHLYQLHESIKALLLPLSDEALAWIIKGCPDTARGGFSDLASLRAFLEKDATSITSSKFITGLEILIMAITLRRPKAWGTLPPEAPEQQCVYNKFLPIIEHDVEDHVTSYPDSRSCRATTYTDRTVHLLNRAMCFSPPCREALSEESGSDIEAEMRAIPPKQNERGIYYKFNTDCSYTWMGAAKDGGIPVRLGISGSTLKSLATIEWILRKAPGELEKQEIEILAGLLLLTTYSRGDYHTVPEVTAALEHFLASRRGEEPSSGVLSPYDALKKGLQLLYAVVHPKYRDSIKSLSEEILRSKTKIPYPDPDDDDSALQLCGPDTFKYPNQDAF